MNRIIRQIWKSAKNFNVQVCLSFNWRILCWKKSGSWMDDFPFIHEIWAEINEIEIQKCAPVSTKICWTGNIKAFLLQSFRQNETKNRDAPSIVYLTSSWLTNTFAPDIWTGPILSCSWLVLLGTKLRIQSYSLTGSLRFSLFQKHSTMLLHLVETELKKPPIVTILSINSWGNDNKNSKRSFLEHIGASFIYSSLCSTLESKLNFDQNS